MPPRPSMKMRFVENSMFCSLQYFAHPFSSVLVVAIN